MPAHRGQMELIDWIAVCKRNIQSNQTICFDRLLTWTSIESISHCDSAVTDAHNAVFVCATMRPSTIEDYVDWPFSNWTANAEWTRHSVMLLRPPKSDRRLVDLIEYNWHVVLWVSQRQFRPLCAILRQIHDQPKLSQLIIASNSLSLSFSASPFVRYNPHHPISSKPKMDLKLV